MDGDSRSGEGDQDREVLGDKPKATDILACYDDSHRITGKTNDYSRIFVSTPNADWCPVIRSIKTPVLVREDGTFGWDDPVCWPQNHHPGAPHLPCTPIFDPDEKSPVYLFRRGLTKKQINFTDTWEGILRMGTISTVVIRALEAAVSRTANRASAFLSTADGRHPRLASLINSLGLAMEKLSKSFGPLPKLRQDFGLAARFCLESEGYIDYHTKYLPRLTTFDHPAIDNNVVGVRTMDEAVCADYLAMGIPVWLIRLGPLIPPFEDYMHKRVMPRNYQSRARLPSDCFRDDGYAEDIVPVFAQYQYDTGVLLGGLDTWARTRLEGEQQTKRKRQQEDGEIVNNPYHEAVNAGVENNNIQNPDLHRSLVPPAVEAWVSAARKFAQVPLEGDQHQPRFFPPIDLITGVTTEERAKEFVAVWRIVKANWLMSVFSVRRPPEFATRKAWKSFIAGSFSTSQFKPGTETSIARINFAEFTRLGKVLSLRREDYAHLREETPGPVHDKITLDMVRQAVCELSDLNFFYDMFDIEYHRTYDPPDDICVRMRPFMSPFSMTVPVPIPRSRLPDRAAWLTAVRDFMDNWPGKKPLGFDINLPDPPTLAEIIPLESAVADFYCSNVTYLLRRRPVVPPYA